MNAMEQLECGLLWRSVWADVYFHVSRSTSANIIDALSLDSIDDRISIWRQLLWIDPSLSAWLLDGVCRGHWSDSSDGPLDPGEILRRLAHWATASQLNRHLERVTCFGPFLTDPIREDVDELKDLSGQSSLGRPAFQPYRCDMGLVARIYLGYRNTIPWRKANDVSGDVWHRVESWQRADEREVAKRLTYIPTEAAASGLQTPSDETVERSERSDTSCDSLLSAASLQSRLMRLARLEELDDAFDRKVEQEKLAAMKELAYGASHEINNPLANIASRAQLLLRDESDPQRRRSLAVIHSQAMRAHEMIADMMLFAKPPKLTCRIIDLSELLVRFRELLQRDLPADVQIDWAVPHEPMRIKADGEQLLLALRAISLNAVEAMRESGRIEVRLIAADVNGPLDVTGVMGNRLTAEWVWIGVLDTGPGIAKDLRTHLFDPFYSGREAGRGLGFGLSKAWRIVDLHGGRIDVHSTEKGAVFWVGLPWACRKLES